MYQFLQKAVSHIVQSWKELDQSKYGLLFAWKQQ